MGIFFPIIYTVLYEYDKVAYPTRFMVSTPTIVL